MSPYEANRVLPPARAFGMALLAYLLFTAGDSMGKWLQADYSAAQILTIINFVGFCIVLGIASWMRGPRQVFKSTKWRQHIFRSSLMAISTMLVLFALKNLPLSDFYGIVFLNPIWVAIISLVFLKQKIPAARWAAIFVGFIGVLIIAGPRFAEMNMGAAAAILASLCSAGAALMARHIGGHEPTTNFSLATHGIMFAANLLILLVFEEFKMPPSQDLALMAFYGLTLALAMLSIAQVFARSHVVSQVAPLQYTQMLWGVIFGWLIFDQPPTERIIIGSVLVMGAGIYILHSLHRGRLMTH